MAIDPELRERDMLYRIGGRPYDHRVEVGDWTYYVMPRHWKAEIKFEGGPTEVELEDELFNAAALKLMSGLARWRRRPWQIRVWRKGSVSGWKDQRLRCVYVERQPHDQDPEPRVLELIAEIEAGRFRPSA